MFCLELITTFHSLDKLLLLVVSCRQVPLVYVVGTLAALMCPCTSVQSAWAAGQPPGRAARDTQTEASELSARTWWKCLFNPLYGWRQCLLPVLVSCPVLAPSPSSISCNRLSILASPSSCAKCRVSTICQATLCRAGRISRSSPKRPLCSQAASSSSSWAWNRRCRTRWGLFKPGQSAGPR